MSKLFKWLLITLLALFTHIIIVYSIHYVINIYYYIQDIYSFFVIWDKAVLLQVITSFIGTLSGSFIIGSYIIKQYRIIIVFYTAIIIFYWLAVLVLYFVSFDITQNFVFDSINIVAPVVLILFTYPAALIGYNIGNGLYNADNDSKFILAIQWYHWLWILPLVIHPALSVILFLITEVIIQSPIISDILILDFILNFGNMINRFILITILSGLLFAFGIFYILIRNNIVEVKFKWIYIFALVSLFNITFLIILISLSL